MVSRDIKDYAPEKPLEKYNAIGIGTGGKVAGSDVPPASAVAVRTPGLTPDEEAAQIEQAHISGRERRDDVGSRLDRVQYARWVARLTARDASHSGNVRDALHPSRGGC
jgi:hypothetical protein